ncbi:hypothetical protein FACS1894184_18420 [Clostridia bacterium]|nr:hypothetical protein FACS1894184_18420 [Clostridia bacterium]
MIVLNNFASAFLRRGDDYLLMKRADNRKISPGIWSDVGGHMEQYELNDPQVTCLREIEEETGITPDQVYNLALRYIIIRRFKDTIRQSYVYFGETDVQPSVETDEGELHWIRESELLDRMYSATFAAMIKHFLTMPDKEHVVVGVAGNDGGRCRVMWSRVEDFESLQSTLNTASFALKLAVFRYC